MLAAKHNHPRQRLRSASPFSLRTDPLDLHHKQCKSSTVMVLGSWDHTTASISALCVSRLVRLSPGSCDYLPGIVRHRGGRFRLWQARKAKAGRAVQYGALVPVTPEGWPRDDLFHDLSAGAVTRPRWSVALCPRLAGCRHGSRAAPAWYRLIVAKRLVRGQWDDIGRYGAFPHVHRPETRGKPPFLRICRRRSHFVRALKALSRLLVSPSRPLRWLLPICLWARRFWRDPLPAPSRTILALNRMIQERASHHPGSFSELPPCEGPLVS